MNISSEFEGESSLFFITAKVSLAIRLLSSEQKLNDIDYWLSHVTKRCNVNTGFSAKDFVFCIVILQKETVADF